MVCRGATVAELFAEDHDEVGDAVQYGPLATSEYEDRGRAREISQVPLCAHCMVDVEVDGLAEPDLVRKGLRRVDKADAGLTRRRWERLRSIKEVKKFSFSCFVCWMLSVDRQQDSMATIKNLPRSTMDGTVSEDYKADTSKTDERALDCEIPLDSTIYVSIMDPLGRPAFKPSPTKPLPEFMKGPRPKTYFEAVPVSRPRSMLSTSSASTVCPSRALTPGVSTPRLSSQSNTKPVYHKHCREKSAHDKKSKRKHTHSLISYEPLKRPSSRLSNAFRRFEECSSSYETSVELPSSSTSSQSVEQFSPLSGKSPQELKKPVDFSPERGHHRLTNPVIPSRTSTPAQHAAQSSEYLERYRPLVSPTSPTSNMRSAFVQAEHAQRLSRREKLSQATSGRQTQSVGPEDVSRGGGKKTEDKSSESGSRSSMKQRRLGAERKRFFVR